MVLPAGYPGPSDVCGNPMAYLPMGFFPPSTQPAKDTWGLTEKGPNMP